MKKLSLITLKKYFFYTYLPLQLVMPAMPTTALTLPFQKPKPIVLPITGSQAPAKDTAQIVGEKIDEPKTWPFYGGNITTRFAYYHPGIDIAIATGTPIKPILPGRVIEASYGGTGYGQTVVVDHGNGITSRYAHLSKINVVYGQPVTIITTIGNVGSTGHSTGPHLHFEMMKDGQPVDPMAMLPKIN